LAHWTINKKCEPTVLETLWHVDTAVASSDPHKRIYFSAPTVSSLSMNRKVWHETSQWQRLVRVIELWPETGPSATGITTNFMTGNLPYTLYNCFHSSSKWNHLFIQHPIHRMLRSSGQLLLIHMQELLGSNLCAETGYTYWRF
jgi:hypothetical protein